MTGIDGAGPTADEVVVTDFLVRYASDREAGVTRSRAAWLALYPGYEATISRELDAIESPPALASGEPEAIGPYRIVRRIGAGGFGTVYLAEDSRIGRLVALKILTGLRFSGPAAAERFRREARAASRVDDPAVCTVFEADVIDEVPFIAMRFVDGVTLSQVIATTRDRRPSREEIRERVGYAAVIARALAAAHASGLIHRDVKPGNIMIDTTGRPVLLDFGAARDIDVATISRDGSVVGTLAYMSPEQLEGGDLDGRTDVYSLGVTLFELVTGERPHRARTFESLLRDIREGAGRDAAAINPAVDRDLAAVVARAIAPERTHRYASAAAFADDLTAVRDGRPPTARPLHAVGRAWRRARRRPLLTALIAALGLTLFVGSVVLARYLGDLPKVRAAEEQARRARLDGLIESGFVDLGRLAPEVAAHRFEAVLAEDPESLEALTGLLLAERRAQHWDAALKLLDQHPRFVAAIPATRRVAADILRDLGRTAEAERLDSEPADADVALNAYLLGMRAMQRADAGDAEEYHRAYDFFTRAIGLSRVPWPVLHFNRAEAAGRAEMLDRARDCAASLRVLWPDSAVAMFYAGFGLSLAGDPDAGREYFKRAVDLDPSSAFNRTALGASLNVAGDRAGARREFRAAVASSPQDQTANFALADILVEDGDRANAIVHLRRGLAKDPDWVEKRLLLARLEAEAGETKAALADVELGLKSLATAPAASDTMRDDLVALREQLQRAESRP